MGVPPANQRRCGCSGWNLTIRTARVDNVSFVSPTCRALQQALACIFPIARRQGKGATVRVMAGEDVAYCTRTVVVGQNRMSTSTSTGPDEAGKYSNVVIKQQASKARTQAARASPARPASPRLCPTPGCSRRAVVTFLTPASSFLTPGWIPRDVSIVKTRSARPAQQVGERSPPRPDRGLNWWEARNATRRGDLKQRIAA